MTDKERLAYAFEKTDSFFKLCTTIRSRRVGRGYRIDSGTDFKHPVTGRAISQQKGPMQFISKKEPKPLTKLEEALISRQIDQTRWRIHRALRQVHQSLEVDSPLRGVAD